MVVNVVGPGSRPNSKSFVGGGGGSIETGSWASNLGSGAFRGASTGDPRCCPPTRPGPPLPRRGLDAAPPIGPASEELRGLGKCGVGGVPTRHEIRGDRSKDKRRRSSHHFTRPAGRDDCWRESRTKGLSLSLESASSQARGRPCCTIKLSLETRASWRVLLRCGARLGNPRWINTLYGRIRGYIRGPGPDLHPLIGSRAWRMGLPALFGPFC